MNVRTSLRKHRKSELMYRRNGHNFTVGDSAIYRIAIAGLLNEGWAEYFGQLSVESNESECYRFVTTLTGCLADQAALIGLLDTLHNMGHPLVSVEHSAEQSSIEKRE